MQSKEQKPQSSASNRTYNPRKRRVIWGVFFLIMLTLILIVNQCSKTNQVTASLQKEEQGAEELAMDTSNVDESSYQGPPVLHFEHRKHSYTAFIFNTSKFNLELFYRNEKNEKYITLKKVKEAVEERGDELLFATNAGIFDPNRHPSGLFVNNGEELAPLNTKDGQGNFFLKPNGVFFMRYDGALDILESEKFRDDAFPVLYATQSGPLLLNEGVIHHAFNEGSPNQLVRNGVGIISPTEAVFIISNDPVNFYDFSMAFKEQFNCQNALYLDGVISQIYLPELESTEKENSFSGMIGVVKIPPVQ